MLSWISEHSGSLMWALGTSAVALVLIVILVGVVLVRPPADHFRSTGQAREKRSEMRHPAWKVFKGVFGWVVLIAGVAMLILPGPGMALILVGVMMAPFSGRDRVQRWLITRRGLFKPINVLRGQCGKPPLKKPLKAISEPADGDAAGTLGHA